MNDIKKRIDKCIIYLTFIDSRKYELYYFNDKIVRFIEYNRGKVIKDDYFLLSNFYDRLDLHNVIDKIMKGDKK